MQITKNTENPLTSKQKNNKCNRIDKRIQAKTNENERYECKNRKKPLKSKTAQPVFFGSLQKRCKRLKLKIVQT